MAIKVSKKEKLKLAKRGVIYGDYKLGKTTFACGAPDPVVISGEGGDGEIECIRVVFEETKRGAEVVPRYIPNAWAEFMGKLREIQADGLPGKTLVLDGFGAIEKLAMASIIGVEKDDKGRPLPSLGWNYGMGDEILLNRMREMLAVLDTIWFEQKAHVILVCHERMTKAFDEGGEYKYMGPALYSTNRGNVVGLIGGWADWIGYLQMEEEEKTIGTTAQGPIKKRFPTQRRLLRMRPSDAYMAGFRGEGPDATIVLPPATQDPTAPWRAFWSQVEAGPLDEAKLRAELKAALPARLAAIKAIDPEQAKKTEAWAAGNPTPRAIWTWLRKAEANGAQPAAA